MRDACRDRLPAVAGKTFPAFPAHAHPQFYVSGKKPMPFLILSLSNTWEAFQCVEFTQSPSHSLLWHYFVWLYMTSDPSNFVLEKCAEHLTAILMCLMQNIECLVCVTDGFNQMRFSGRFEWVFLHYNHSPGAFMTKRLMRLFNKLLKNNVYTRVTLTITIEESAPNSSSLEHVYYFIFYTT